MKTVATLLETTEDFPDQYEDGHYWLSQDGNTLYVVIPGIGDMCPLPLNDQSFHAADVKGRWRFDPATATVTPSIHRRIELSNGQFKTQWHGWLRDGYFHKI